LRINNRFEGACRLHLQGSTISEARNQHEADSKNCFCNCSSLASIINYVHVALNVWTLQHNQFCLFYRLLFSVTMAIYNKFIAFAPPLQAHIPTPAFIFMALTQFLYPSPAHVPPPLSSPVPRPHLFPVLKRGTRQPSLVCVQEYPWRTAARAHLRTLVLMHWDARLSDTRIHTLTQHAHSEGEQCSA
jgi:hypothetical protein